MCVFYVVVVAVVVVIVDVDDEEGEGRGEDAQRRKSNNSDLKGFLSCMNLYHINIVRMQCCALELLDFLLSASSPFPSPYSSSTSRIRKTTATITT